MNTEESRGGGIDLESQEAQAMADIFAARSNIIKKIGADKIIEHLKKLVVAAEGVEFASERGERYIDAHHPVLKLRYNYERIKKLHPAKAGSAKGDDKWSPEATLVRSYLAAEIGSKLTEFMFGEIRGDVDIEAILSKLRDKYPQFRVRSFVFDSMYSTRVETEGKNCYIEFYLK
jgi:hypothetical protein